VADLREAFDRRRPDFPAGTPFWKDRSFARLLADCPELRPMEAWLHGAHDDGALQAPASIPSSYRDHGYGAFFYALVRCLKPRRCIELGVLRGFSLLAVARALHDNGAGRIDGYDLFEDYPYTREPYAAVVERIRLAGLQDRAGVHRSEAGAVAETVENIDYLHVDLSNDGDRFRQVFEHWSAKVAQVIVLEGGSAARDEVAWMLRHARPPIAAALAELRRGRGGWTFAVLEPYPSLTVAIRRPVAPGLQASSRTMNSMASE